MKKGTVWSTKHDNFKTADTTIKVNRQKKFSKKFFGIKVLNFGANKYFRKKIPRNLKLGTFFPMTFCPRTL